jgi:hypothetical protein
LKIEADPNAQAFYKKVGIHQIGEHHSKVKDQREFVCMGKMKTV